MTKSWNYNKAVKDLVDARELTSEQVRTFFSLKNGEEAGTIKHNDKESQLEKSIGGFDCWYKVAIEATEAVKKTGAYPYLAHVADKMLDLMGIAYAKESETVRKRAEHIVYGTNVYMRAKSTIEKYDKMLAAGYIHTDDCTDDMHGKMALLSGTSEHDWLTIRKNDEKIKLYIKGDMRGYMRPRMRTRYFTFGIGNDQFIKLKRIVLSIKA